MKYLKTYENISTKNKNKEIFNYNSQIYDHWRPIISDAMKFQNISFDLENNDSTKEKKTITVTKLLRKDQPVKTVINAELWEAGGDWQNPVMYFKIEFANQYNIIKDKYKDDPKFVWDVERKNSSRHFVIIPPVEAGNALKKLDNDRWCAFDGEDDSKNASKEQKELMNISKDDKSKAWKWLEKTMEDLIESRWEMLDK